MKVSELAKRVDGLRTEMDGKFAVVDKKFEELRREIRAEGETTRRHFEVVAEKMSSERNLSLDKSMATAQQLTGLTASNAEDHVHLGRLDDHERRIDTIERGRATDPVWDPRDPRPV